VVSGQRSAALSKLEHGAPNMKRREEWRPILEAEIKRWSAKSCAELLSELSDERCYEIEREGKNYQVEVHLFENTNTYLLLGVSVDDGSIPASFSPLSSSFRTAKE
jgi:hypothetical protein